MHLKIKTNIHILYYTYIRTGIFLKLYLISNNNKQWKTKWNSIRFCFLFVPLSLQRSSVSIQMNEVMYNTGIYILGILTYLPLIKHSCCAHKHTHIYMYIEIICKPQIEIFTMMIWDLNGARPKYICIHTDIPTCRITYIFTGCLSACEPACLSACLTNTHERIQLECHCHHLLCMHTS